VNRAKSSRSDRISSDLKEINIFVGLTLIIFFVAIGFPTLINTSPSLGYEGIDFTPVTTMYQEAYAEMELRETIFWYGYNPLLFDSYTYKWLVSLAPPEFPPDDPFTRYLENQIELGTGLVKQLLTEPLIPSAYAVHNANHTYPDPYLYMDFDVSSINPDGRTWENLGTAGSIADGFNARGTDNSIPPNYQNFTIQLNSNSLDPQEANLEANGVLGEAVNVFGFTSSTADQDTWIQFGSQANRNQWKFLTENNDNGVILGSNLTSMNFWYFGDITNGGDTHTPILGLNCGNAQNGMGLWRTTSSTNLRVNIENRDGSTPVSGQKYGNQIGGATLQTSLQWHMITVTLNKTTTIENEMEVYIDNVLSGTYAQANTWDSVVDSTLLPNPLILGMSPRHADPFSSSCEGMNGQEAFDELAVWDDHLLNSTERDFLWNNGDGNRVLGTFGQATFGFNILNLTDITSDTITVTDPSPPLPPLAPPLEVTPFTRNSSDVWELREHHTNATIKTGVNFTETPAGVLGVFQDLGASDVGSAWIFKTFNDTDVQGKEIVIDIDGNATDPNAGEHYWEFVHIYDCELNAFDFGDFGDGDFLPSCTDSPPISGNGSLNDPAMVIPFDIGKSMHSDIIDLDAVTPHTSPLVTVLIRTVDNNITSGNFAQLHSISIGNTTVGQRTWNFTSPELYWESFFNGTDKACETDDLICNNNFGLVRTTVTDLGRTYPDPYMYMDFDVSSINPDGNTWENLGTAGSIADGFNARGTDNLTPPSFQNFTIQLHQNDADPQVANLEAGGILGEAVLVSCIW
jgi:hypothetical protein